MTSLPPKDKDRVDGDVGGLGLFLTKEKKKKISLFVAKLLSSCFFPLLYSTNQREAYGL